MMNTLGSVLLFIVSCQTITSAALPPEGLLIDKVWSGHPVPFALLTERGHQYVAYYDSERRLTVASRRLDSDKLTRVHPEGVPVPKRDRMSNVTGWDSHNHLSMALDRDGHLHLSGNMHADPLVYYRTRRPFDIESLQRIDRMTGEREERVTYPQFFKDKSGGLIFRYRDGGSGKGSDLYNLYDPERKTWSRLFDGPLLDGESKRSAYGSGPQPGPDGRFHMVWMWRDTPDAMTNHTLSYARSPDLFHWESSTGEAISRPITIARGEVIDAAAPGEGLVNMSYALGFDQQQRPTVTYHRFDKEGRSQAYIARPGEEGKWQIRQLSDWNFRWDFSGMGSQTKQVSISRPVPEGESNLLASYRTKEAGSGSWLLSGATLEVLEHRPASAKADAKVPNAPDGRHPGLLAQSLKSRSDDRTWVLRWNTLGINRDQENRSVPPPSELRLHELSATDLQDP